MDSVVQDLLERDYKFRQDHSFNDDIFKLNDLNRNAEWDYSLPTLVRDDNKSIHQSFKQITLNTFKTRFLDKFPFFTGFNWQGVLAAGSAVGQFIMGDQSNDIDLFIYGSNIDEANKIIRRILKHVIKYENNKYNKLKTGNSTVTGDNSAVTDDSDVINETNITFIKRKNTITIDEYDIQLILRIYKSPSEIIHGFDLGSSAVGFDGSNLYFTSLSKFAYEYGCNIVDTTRRSTTYERRLIKYFDRGFEIILPRFNIKKTSNRLMDLYDLNEYCEMPYLVFTYKCVTGNKIVVSQFYNKKNTTISDYGVTDVCDEYSAFYSNLYNILHHKFDDFVVVSKNINDIILGIHKFLGNKIDYFYANLEKSIQSDKFPTSVVEKYITICSCEDVFKARHYPTAIINQQVTHVKNLIKNVSGIGGIKWMITDPMTQLTSSYNPIIDEQSAWYGLYYT